MDGEEGKYVVDDIWVDEWMNGGKKKCMKKLLKGKQIEWNDMINKKMNRKEREQKKTGLSCERWGNISSWEI